MHVIRLGSIFNQAGGLFVVLGKYTGLGWISGMRSLGIGTVSFILLCRGDPFAPAQAPRTTTRQPKIQEHVYVPEAPPTRASTAK